MTRTLASVLVWVAFSSIVMAQKENDNCDLSVHVRTENERTIDSPIQVEVLGPGGVLKSTQVVGDATVDFQVGSGRSYRLRVSGSNIETVTTAYFTVNALEQSHVETVNVRMTSDNAGTKVTAGAASISVSEMSVPKKARAAMNKGLAAYSKGELEKAAGYFVEAAADYPHYSRAYDLLGAIAMKGSDRTKAREMFTKSIEADKTYVPAYVDLARMEVQDRRFADAESELEKAVALDPALPEALAMLATAEFANHEYEKALADVERMHALRDHQQYAEVHVMAGKVLRMQNRPQAAIEQFNLFLLEKPESPEAASVREAVATLEAAGRH